MSVKPTRKNVLVAENKSEYKSDAGLIIESSSALDSKTGTVIAVGSEVTEVNVGDVIYLEWNKGKIVKIDDAQRVMIDVKYIVGVLES